MNPLWVIAGIGMGFALARALKAELPRYPGLFAHRYEPIGVILSGLGWPRNGQVRLTIMNEPYLFDGGKVNTTPPRLLTTVKADKNGQFLHVVNFPETKVRGSKPLHLKDVSFEAFNPPLNIIRTAAIKGSVGWYEF